MYAYTMFHTGIAGDITEHTGVVAASAVAAIYLFPRADMMSKIIMGGGMGVALDYVGRTMTGQHWHYNRMTSVAVSGAAGTVGGSYLYNTFM